MRSARSYLAHWSPPATRRLWAQCLHVLDGLNAAVYEALAGWSGVRLRARGVLAALGGARDWRRFCEGLDRPQVLLPPPAR